MARSVAAAKKNRQHPQHTSTRHCNKIHIRGETEVVPLTEAPEPENRRVDSAEAPSYT
jgi:hypothetical protein